MKLYAPREMAALEPATQAARGLLSPRSHCGGDSTISGDMSRERWGNHLFPALGTPSPCGPGRKRQGGHSPRPSGVDEDDRGPWAAGAARGRRSASAGGGRPPSCQLACGSGSAWTGQPPQGSPESIAAKKEDRAVSVAIQSQLWDEDSCTREGFRKG